MQGTRSIDTPRRRLSASERREALLDASRPLFATRGYESTSIGEIAAAASVTKPVVYDHFPSKQALYIALVEREAESISSALTASFDPTAPLDERLRTLALAAIGYARRHPDSSLLLLKTPTGDASIRAAHERLHSGGRAAIAAAILADPVFEAAPGLSRQASAELLGDLHNAVLERLVHWALEHPGTTSKALAEVFVDVLWRGLNSYS
jgi:AcrR family transcriptional regulator